MAEQDREQDAKTDSTILKFLGEQVFGKAPQPLTDDEGNAISIAAFTFSIVQRESGVSA